MSTKTVSDLTREQNLVESAWAFFETYLERKGFAFESTEVLNHPEFNYNMRAALGLFWEYWRNTWVDFATDNIIDPVADYFGLEHNPDFSQMFKWCPDQVAMIRLGIGPYLEQGVKTPIEVVENIALELGIKAPDSLMGYLKKHFK